MCHIGGKFGDFKIFWVLVEWVLIFRFIRCDTEWLKWNPLNNLSAVQVQLHHPEQQASVLKAKPIAIEGKWNLLYAAAFNLD